MHTVSIIAEYNPFHFGHLYQIEKIRKHFGNETAIVAIMSGNYVQRGECASFDKFLRAEAAVKCGVNLVLELPFPFSMSGAGYFADKAVALIDQLQIADVLAFGTEEDSLDTLSFISETVESDGFETQIRATLQNKSNINLGYAKIRENVLSSVADKETLRAPNNLLAIEYLAALKRRRSSIKPFAVKRNHPHDSSFQNANLASASLIRKHLKNGEFEKAFSLIPKNAAEVFKKANYKSYDFSQNTTGDVILSTLRLHPQKQSIFEMTEELRHRLSKASLKATDYSDLIEQTRTARYTTARVRRAVLHATLGTTSAQMSCDPCYTQLLACDKVGMRLLKQIKQNANFPILTKPADMQKLPENARLQANFCAKADALYGIFRATAQRGDTFLKATPFCAHQNDE